MYYLYILRCEDNSLYTGITTDVNRRFEEHLAGRGVGAKYTKTHIPQKIELQLAVGSRAEASKLEFKIKHIKKCEKENLLKSGVKSFAEVVEFLENLTKTQKFD